MSAPTGGRLSAARQVIRDAAIIEAIRAGERQIDVAKRYGITTRQVRRITEAYELEATGIDDAPMRVVHRILTGYTTQMRMALALAEESVDSMPAVTIASLRAYAEALERYRGLMGEIGKLPEDLSLLRAESALERLLDQMMSVMRRVEAGEVAAREALAELDRLRGVDPNAGAHELGPGDVLTDP